MISLIKGGDYVKKGYYYSIYITFPEFINYTTININKTEHKSTKLTFPSGFYLTRNNTYCNILLCLFGFGLGFEIQSKV